MKSLFFLTFLVSLAFVQAGLVAQPLDTRPEPRVEEQTRYPRSAYEDPYDNQRSSPQRQVDYRQDSPNRSYNQDARKGYDNQSARDSASYSQDKDDEDEDDFDENEHDAGQGSSSVQQNARTSHQSVYSREAYDQSTPTLGDNMPQQKIERTLSILKPDAVKNRHIGDIISRFENNGLRVVGIKMARLTREQAAQFYNIHRDRPFFNDLTQFMSSGPVVLLVLEGNNAISKNRQLMGATDPNKAEKGTIRADFAKSVSQNAVHGSDSSEAARQEIPFFFQANELYSGY